LPNIEFLEKIKARDAENLVQVCPMKVFDIDSRIDKIFKVKMHMLKI